MTEKSGSDKSELTATSDYDHLFKLLLIGDSGVGKSCLLLRYADNVWEDRYISTLGVDFKIRTLEVNKKIIRLQIWDTSGQERFHTITSSYYRGSHAILVMYDITDETTFNNVKTWMIEIEHYAKEDVVKVLVGCKCDLEVCRKVSFEQGQEFATKAQMPFFETSAKTNQGVDVLFTKIAEELVRITPKPTQTEAVDLKSLRKTKGKEKKRFTCLL